MIDKPLAGAVQRLHILLLYALLGHQRNVGLAHGRADRLGIVAVVLLPAHERFHILRADDLHLVAKGFKLARPAEGARAGLDRDRTRFDAGKHSQQLIAHDPAFENRIAFAIRAMELKYVLRQVDTEDIYGHRFSPSKFGYTTVLRGGRAVHPIRWRKEYGGLKTDQARRMKDLEKENQRLRRAISDLTLDKLILQEAAKGNF